MRLIASSITLLVCLAIPAILNSTCIGILIKGKTIYVVADTRRTIPGRIISTGKKFELLDTINKINHVGDFYFAIAGHHDGALLKAASKIDKNKTLLDNVNSFAKQMKMYYEKAMPEEKKTWLDEYSFYLTGKLAEVAFFSNKNGNPILYVVYISMEEINGIPIISYIIKDNLGIVFLGVHDHIKITPEKGKSYYQSKNPIDTLTKLVKLEMKYHKEWIACPLDILEWTTTRPVIRRKACN